MTRILALFALIGFIAIALPALVIAQAVEPDPSLPPIDFGTLFASSAALGAFVVALVAFVKSKFWPTLEGWQTIAVSFGLCLAIPLTGMLFGVYNPVNGWKEALSFGFMAFVLASGGYKAVQQATQPKLPPAGGGAA